LKCNGCGKAVNREEREWNKGLCDQCSDDYEDRMNEAGSPVVSKDGNASPIYPVASGRGVETPRPDPLTLQVISKIEKDLETIKASLQSFTLLQQQLQIIERQLDSVTVLVSRSFSATVNPAAVEVARKQAEEQAKDIQKQIDEEREAEINARGGDHPPTEEEMAAAQNESLL